MYNDMFISFNKTLFFRYNVTNKDEESGRELIDLSRRRRIRAVNAQAKGPVLDTLRRESQSTEEAIVRESFR